ncbi:MAG: ABC transporter ATP-binding protein, partial [Clostridia bacterium]|nr:ABC transporter ATP-binding protein [Clostridia bacterium]
MQRNKYDIDETLDQSFDFSKLGRALVYVKPYASKMLFVLVLACVAVVLSLISPTLLQRAMDVAIPNRDVQLLIKLGIICIVVTAINPVLSAIRSYLMSKVGQSIILDIRRDVFSHLQKLPFAYYDSRPHGKILVRVVNYVNNVSDMLTNGMITAIVDLINMVFIAVFMFMLSPKLALIVLSGLPVLFAVIFYMKGKQKKANLRFNNKNSNLTAFTCEHINGVKVSQIFARQDENMDIYDRLNRDYRDAWFTRLYLTNSLGPITSVLSRIVISFVYVGGVMLFVPMVDVGVIIAMGTYAQRFWQPVISLANIYNNLLTTLSYLERIFQLLDEPIDISDKEGAHVIENMRGEVEFSGVSFSYEKGVKVLDNISFKVEAGQSVALVGETGSGKTTIVNLLSRFYDASEGQVKVDGVDVRDITIHSLRSHMGIMLQDSFIFSGTIRDNIRYGKLDATDEEIEAACRAVCVHDFIMSMPDGYDTVVNERGGSLSEGQKQLIALARTMVSDPSVIVLDEATSSIDAKTEKMLKDGIDKLLVGRTSFIIAHRLATIRNCDRIMLIDRGRIIEDGSHEELMALGGRYHHLCTVQSKGFEAAREIKEI